MTTRQPKSNFLSVIVSLHPNGLIGFRPKGTRREYLVPIQRVYLLAVQAHVADQKRQRAEDRRLKRKGVRDGR